MWDLRFAKIVEQSNVFSLFIKKKSMKLMNHG